MANEPGACGPRVLPTQKVQELQMKSQRLQLGTNAPGVVASHCRGSFTTYVHALSLLIFGSDITARGSIKLHHSSVVNLISLQCQVFPFTPKSISPTEQKLRKCLEYLKESLPYHGSRQLRYISSLIRRKHAPSNSNTTKPTSSPHHSHPQKHRRPTPKKMPPHQKRRKPSKN